MPPFAHCRQQAARQQMQMPAAMPGAMPGAMPAAMQGGMPGAMQGGMPGAMQGGMPGGMPSGMPSGMPGGMPGAGHLETSKELDPHPTPINCHVLSGHSCWHAKTLDAAAGVP